MENQGGSSASKRIATDAGNALGGVEKVGLEEIHAYALKDSVMGQYESRRTRVYEAVKASSLADVSATTNTTTPTTSTTTATTAQNGSNSIQNGDSVTFTGGGVYKFSTATNAPHIKDVTSKCRVTATNPGSLHPYHLISQDGKGIYGWVNAVSVKEVSITAQNDPASVEKGDTVTFTGGPVYKSSTAAQAAKTKNVTSTCKVTAINTKGTHPYHLISQDGKGIYGWVDKADVK